MKLFLARHPKTEANQQGLVLGQGDSPLTVEGISTFQRVMEWIRHEKIHRIISSPLPRALAGARIAAKAMECSMEIEPGLRELSCSQWEGLDRRALDLKEGRLRRHWSDRPPDGESYLEAEARLLSVITNLEAWFKKGPVLVIGHAVVYRVFLKLWLGLNPEEVLKFHQDFHEVHVLSRQRLLNKIVVDGKK